MGLSRHALCRVAEVADLIQQRLEATAATLKAEWPAAEPGPCMEASTQPALSAVPDVQPAASLPHDDAVRLLQTPVSPAAGDISDGQPLQSGAASPSVSEPATELQSSQPAATKSPAEGIEDASSPEQQQPAWRQHSPDANGAVVHAAEHLAADSTLHKSNPIPTPAVTTEDLAVEARTDTQPPDSIPGPAGCETPAADVSGIAAADAADASGGANPSAASVDEPCGSEPATGASEGGPGLSAANSAHLPVRLAVSHQDDTVNVTSASPRCISPGAGPGQVLGEGPVSIGSPSLGRSAAAAFAAVSQHIHEYDDAHVEAGAQSLLRACSSVTSENQPPWQQLRC